MIVSPRYHEFRSRFVEAMDPAFWNGEYLDEQVLLGKADCWFSDNAAIVARIEDYPGGARVIEGLVAAGELDEIKGLIAQAEIWGKSVGCSHAMIQSREGWLRELKDYSLWQTSIVKAL